MSISALPTPPDRSDPATFSSRADAFLGALPTFATEANALATQANSDAAVASAAAIGTLAASGTSTDSLTIGTGSKSITTQTGKAITAGMSMKWAMQSDAAKYMTGTVTSYDAGTGALVMNMTATNGSGTAAAWEGVVTAAASGSTITRRAITGTDTVGVSDIAKLIDITSGTFTLAFTACATLGNGAWGYIRNSGTGDVTLDPDGSEQIDGLTSFVMYPGAVRLWQCDGSAIRTVALSGGTKTFASTANYIWAPGVQAWDYDAIAGGAGGGGGARSGARYNGGGAGAGERRRGRLMKSQVTVGGSATCTVGAKGTGGAAAAADNTSGTAGTSGGSTSIGALVTVSGGSGTNNAALEGAFSGRGATGGGTGFGTGAGITALAGQLRDSNLVTTVVDPLKTEWGGPSGRNGDDPSTTRIAAVLGGQSSGLGGGAVAAGTAGANGVNPGDGGDGGGGNINGSAAGKGGDGVDGQITITEVI